MAKKRETIKEKAARLKNAENTSTPSVERKEDNTVKVVKKTGRPSDKVEGVKYRRLGLTIPVDTVAKLQVLLGQMKGKGIYETQNALVNAALLEYIDNHLE